MGPPKKLADSSQNRRMKLSWVAGSLTALLLGSTLVWALTASGLYIDEASHYDQILRFARGDLSLNPWLTTLPGYHALLGGVGYVTGVTSLPFMRGLSFLIGLGAIGGFWRLSHALHGSAGALRVLQFTFFPILFPFFFLLYTDVLALLCVLLACVCMLHGRVTLAAMMSLAGVLVRQTNIVWLLFVFVLGYTRLAGFSVERHALMAYARRAWLFLVVGVVFSAFVALNRGIAIGDRTAHPVGGLSMGNLFFGLFLAFFLFFPLLLSYRQGLRERLKKRQTWLVLLGSFLLYILTFAPTHPYNQAQPMYFLRNWVLMCCSTTLTGKLLCFLPVAGALLLFAAVSLRERAFVLLYPTTVLFFLPMWLIEQRYTLIPFTLFLALREQGARAAEESMVLVYVVSALVFMYGVLSWLFFL
jgi:alpha-1,2-glucosyltransferase